MCLYNASNAAHAPYQYCEPTAGSILIVALIDVFFEFLDLFFDEWRSLL